MEFDIASFNIYLCLLLGMLFLHIVDDFVLQPICLSKLKQKITWDRYCEDKPLELKRLYKNDYLVATAIHALSWSVCIMLPWIFMYGGELGWLIFLLVIINTIIHAYVDDLKANREKINLKTDQFIHFLQIYVAWACLVVARTIILFMQFN